MMGLSQLKRGSWETDEALKYFAIMTLLMIRPQKSNVKGHCVMILCHLVRKLCFSKSTLDSSFVLIVKHIAG